MEREETYTIWRTDDRCITSNNDNLKQPPLPPTNKLKKGVHVVEGSPESKENVNEEEVLLTSSKSTKMTTKSGNR